MRVLLRLLAPLLGLAMAAAGLLLVIEVVAAWVRPGVGTGLVVPWPEWRTTLENLTWAESPVPGVAIAVAVAGLLLLLVGLLARRSDVVLDAPGPEMTVTTSPKVLARLVGRRVRTTEDVAGATVTATARRVAVSVEGWNDPGPELGSAVEARVSELLDQLPLHVRPRVSVSVQDRKGLR
jgi:hypothetical protein